MTAKSQRLRILLLLIVLQVGFLAVLVRLFQIQCINSTSYPEQVLWTWVKRGNIYGRRSYELASNRDTISVFADPKRLSPQQRVRASRALAPLLDMSATEIAERLARDKRFVWLKRKLDYSALGPLEQTLKEQRLRGIRYKREQKRVYPNGDLVPHVVGFANFDNIGIDGIERSYEDWMTSYERPEYVRHDAFARPTDPRYVRTKGPDLSNSVFLTIDEMIQHAAQAALTEACEQWRAQTGSVIVMKPDTGEVLAMANYPSLDLNKYGQTQEFNKRNRAIWFDYEPGSGFKAFTMAGALSEGVVTPETIIDCENGAYDYHGHLLHDTHPSGRITATEVLVRSSNIGMAKISDRLGIKRLGQYVRAFGFGQPTGIDLPFERSGNVSVLDQWGDHAAGFIGFGHGITVTPLQMLVAMNAIANGGVLVSPHVAHEVRNAGGKVLMQAKPAVTRRILSPKVAEQLRQMLVHVVEDRKNHEAQIPGIRVAGKTGTAQKADEGGYSKTDFVSSFIGFAPAEDPQVSIIIVIDRPRGEHLGRIVAAPVFSKVAAYALELMAADSQLVYSGQSSDALAAIK